MQSPAIWYAGRVVGHADALSLCLVTLTLRIPCVFSVIDYSSPDLLCQECGMSSYVFYTRNFFIMSCVSFYLSSLWSCYVRMHLTSLNDANSISRNASSKRKRPTLKFVGIFEYEPDLSIRQFVFPSFP